MNRTVICPSIFFENCIGYQERNKNQIPVIASPLINVMCPLGRCPEAYSIGKAKQIVQEITRNVAKVFSFYAIIAIEHGFSCINIRQIPWEVLKTEAECTEKPCSIAIIA